MAKAEKPKKHTKSRYDYHECVHFLERKYKYEERDYAGRGKFHIKIQKETDKKFGDKSWYAVAPKDATPNQLAAIQYHAELRKNEPPYLDFWHFIIDHCNIMGNGCDFTMYVELMDSAEPWQKEILQHYSEKDRRNRI